MSEQNLYPAARLLCFQIYFYLKQSNSDVDLSDKSLLEIRETIETPDEEADKISKNPKTLELARHILGHLLEKEGQIKEMVNSVLHQKNADKLSKTEFALIMLGSSELLQNTATDLKNVINTYINLSKKYGTKDSYSLVNGVLDSVRASVR